MDFGRPCSYARRRSTCGRIRIDAIKHIGVLGFGEAGSTFAAALAAAGAAVSCYDRRWDADDEARLDARGAGHPGIDFCRLPALYDAAEVILSAVTTTAALDAARAGLPYLKAGQVYCDLNSTAPAVKRELAGLIESSGADFVEGAILGAIGVSGARTRILLGGERAGDLAPRLNAFGLDAVAYSLEIGRASTFKLLRSVFSKGLEALLLEFLLAGERAGLRDELWDEVTALMAGDGFEPVARNWVCSHALAHERRYHELIQVQELLEELGVDPVMTDASRRLFERSTRLGLGASFGARPDAMEEVVDKLLERLTTETRL